MKVLYFAWLRNKIGASSEEVSAPEDVQTVQQLIDWLKERGEGYADAFNDPSVIRAAVNQEHVGFDHPIKTGDEVAFFPPVTGG